MCFLALGGIQRGGGKTTIHSWNREYIFKSVTCVSYFIFLKGNLVKLELGILRVVYIDFVELAEKEELGLCEWGVVGAEEEEGAVSEMNEWLVWVEVEWWKLAVGESLAGVGRTKYERRMERWTERTYSWRAESDGGGRRRNLDGQ